MLDPGAGAIIFWGVYVWISRLSSGERHYVVSSMFFSIKTEEPEVSAEVLQPVFSDTGLGTCDCREELSGTMCQVSTFLQL